jgi:sugar-specific transcriptional regulator TrmB
MRNEDRELQILSKLGLTPLEARTLLTLYSLGRESIEKIATATNIDRSNTSHIVKRLQKIGLVAQILGKPTLYEPIPLKEAISILIGTKDEELKAIQKQAEELANSKDYRKSLKPLEYEMKVVGAQKKSTEQEVIQSIKNIEQSFDLIISKRIFVDYFINLSGYQLNCVKRGIEYRLITELENIQQHKKKIHPFLKYSNFHLRYVTKPLQTELGVNDKKSATVILIPFVPLKDSAKLITNHPGCLQMFQTYFDKIWSEAQEYKIEK